MTKNTRSKKYALLSVSDKTGIVDLANTLVSQGFKIISTGGTAKTLSEQNINVVPIQSVTGNPESFDGRMKTISFQIESGILYDRNKKTHQKEAEDLSILPIDIVVCNLYPFEETIKQKNVTLTDAIENIDVGGPTMIRSAAKNFKHVTVLTDPNDYESVATHLKENSLTESIRQTLSAKAFYHLSFYDSQIASYLSDELFPTEITLPGRKIMDLRYGENPHQKGSMYVYPQNNSPFANLTKHWGRDLSLTNVTDINAGIESARLFDTPCAVVIKHNNPCGIALGSTIGEALSRAIDADPESAFGGVIVLNRPIDQDIVQAVSTFKKEGRGNFDIISAPRISNTNLQALSELRKSMGIYTFGDIPKKRIDKTQVKWIDGGFLYQEGDNDIKKQFPAWTVVTKKKPTKKQLEQMEIAWKFIAKIKSNSILIMDKTLPMTRGIGSGQTSRIRSTKIAFDQAGEYAKGAIMASDSFFPFDDSVQLAGKYGIEGIIQQGGSINDQASIDAADALGIAMVFTGHRAFWH